MSRLSPVQSHTDTRLVYLIIVRAHENVLALARNQYMASGILMLSSNIGTSPTKVDRTRR